ncbi:hypothetical protein P5W99_37845 [Paraburkholderia sp. A3BS-1L]|uniref:hypothetical protein n=1 Tax=Paraburkholderia sp. A3BS-1L TaxID=3028375 RepID=UPI003DA97A04
MEGDNGDSSRANIPGATANAPDASKDVIKPFNRFIICLQQAATATQREPKPVHDNLQASASAEQRIDLNHQRASCPGEQVFPLHGRRSPRSAGTQPLIWEIAYVAGHPGPEIARWGKQHARGKPELKRAGSTVPSQATARRADGKAMAIHLETD